MVDFRELSKDSFFHSLVSRVEKIEVQQSYTLLEQKQAYLKSNNEEEPRDLDWLRRANCWRLWQERGLSVKEISFALHMQPDTIINNILSFERKMENVDWFRLCDLVKLTSGVAESILVGRAKAKRKLSSSSGAVVFSASDIKKFCPQNVTLPHISLVHAMLGRGLLSSKIVQITSCTFENECEEVTVNELHQAQYIGTASKSTTHVATNGQLSEPRECDGREETAGFANPVSDFKPYEAQEHTHDDAVRKEENSSASRTVNAVANGQLAVPHVCHGGWQETAAFANRDFDLEYNKHYECIHHQGLVFCKKYKSTFQDTAGQRMEVSKEFLPSPTVGTSKNVVTLSDILQWLQKNDGATLSNIVHTFEDCDAKHLLRLLLELMENSLLVQCHGKLRVAPEKCSSRLEMPRMMLLPTVLRMQRAKCLNGFVLSIIIHEPKRNVEFTIRSMKPCGCSIDYRVHIFKYPSCTCPDFCSRVAGGLDYIPCKHLFYVYMRQLVLGMDMEHVMHQEILTEADLERILEAYY